jgi:phage shock protein PspC (stress-responsive transcriptional regulator)
MPSGHRRGHARAHQIPYEKGKTDMDNIREAFRREGLVRVKEGRVIGGVVAGLGRRWGIDPWRARLLFVLILLVIPGSQFLVYPILWMLMPEEAEPVTPTSASYSGANLTG